MRNWLISITSKTCWWAGCKPRIRLRSGSCIWMAKWSTMPSLVKPASSSGMVLPLQAGLAPRQHCGGSARTSSQGLPRASQWPQTPLCLTQNPVHLRPAQCQDPPPVPLGLYSQ
jgi:hypothetical protein